MNQDFASDEKLYRAVYPKSVASMFWKNDGTISSAAFADKKGLSVDRGNYRKDEEVVADIRKRLVGSIVSVTVGQCMDVDAEVLYLPSKNNPYHSEIHGDNETVLLSKHQRRYLAINAKLEYSECSG